MKKLRASRAPPRRGKGSVSVASMNCLPDELLIQILSFLPTKQAASTSVLSKRWRTLFNYRHDLDFDELMFLHPVKGKEYEVGFGESFRSFIDRLLDFQGGTAPINKFSLRCGDVLEEDVPINRWISTVLSRGVSEIHLTFTERIHCNFPSSFYMSKTVVKLSLGPRLTIDDFHYDTCLPVLKVLFIDCVWFSGHDSSACLIDACPALEDLTLHYKEYIGGKPNLISSKTMKILSITYACPEYYGSISLDTPNVVNLYYSDYARREFPNFHLDSLVKATLDLHFMTCRDPLDPNVTDLMYGIRNVKILDLTSSSVEVISEGCEGGLPEFKNLSEMCLVFPGSNIQYSKMLLPAMIEKSPNLKSLVLSGLDFNTYKPRFLGIYIPSNQIKFLDIMECQGSANELNHVKHFLLKMKCLEKVRVHLSASLDDSRKRKIRKELLKLSKASSKLTMKVI